MFILPVAFELPLVVEEMLADDALEILGHSFTLLYLLLDSPLYDVLLLYVGGEVALVLEATRAMQALVLFFSLSNDMDLLFGGAAGLGLGSVCNNRIGGFDFPVSFHGLLFVRVFSNYMSDDFDRL